MRKSARTLLTETCGLAIAIPVTLMVMVGVARPHADELAAVFPPWWSSARALTAVAGAGQVVALGRVPGTVVVRGDPAALAGRLRAAGAIFSIDTFSSAGCRAGALEIAP